MEVFKTKEFARLASRAGVDDSQLREAVARAERGLIDAPIGKFLVKQRVARPGQGRSGGWRAILFFKEKNRTVFLHLFAKNKQANLTPAETDTYREFAAALATVTPEQTRRLVAEGKWIGIDYEAGEETLSERSTALPPSRDKGPRLRRRDR